MSKPVISDAAVEAFYSAWAKYDEPDRDWRAIRAGLAAALPHLATSGEYVAWRYADGDLWGPWSMGKPTKSDFHEASKKGYVIQRSPSHESPAPSVGDKP